MNQIYFKAVYAAYPNAVTINANSIVFDSANNVIEVDQNVISDKIIELEAAEPMRLLREERDRLIAFTDWRFRSDLSPSQAWIDYSQSLRDLPATASPSLDENGNLTGVTWPTPPSE